MHYTPDSMLKVKLVRLFSFLSTAGSHLLAHFSVISLIQINLFKWLSEMGSFLRN